MTARIVKNARGTWNVIINGEIVASYTSLDAAKAHIAMQKKLTRAHDRAQVK
jgi:hypothetical protein